jgi:polysaccharide export outer membrane protein
MRHRSSILLCLWLAGCAPGSDLPPLPDAPLGEYRLGPGDQLRVITFADEQLTGEFHVSDHGTISLPLLGPVPVAGRTTTEAEQEISRALKKAELFRSPSVSVEVLAYRPVFILGEVAKPGQYPYQPGMTVVTAVSVAGGFTYRAIEDYASIIRTTDGRATEARASRQSFVEPGDVITVYERRF